MRIGARNELPGRDQPLLGKIEMEDAVSRSRVVRFLDPVQPRELTPDPGLLVVIVFAR